VTDALGTLADWSRIGSVVLVLAQGVLVWILWSLRKQFVSRDHCDKQCQKADNARTSLEREQARLEQAQANAPSGREMTTIKDQLAELSGEMKAIGATTTAQAKAMERVTHQLDLLLENELNGGR
jgi:hypothetical protein